MHEKDLNFIQSPQVDKQQLKEEKKRPQHMTCDTWHVTCDTRHERCNT